MNIYLFFVSIGLFRAGDSFKNYRTASVYSSHIRLSRPIALIKRGDGLRRFIFDPNDSEIEPDGSSSDSGSASGFSDGPTLTPQQLEALKERIRQKIRSDPNYDMTMDQEALPVIYAMIPGGHALKLLQCQDELAESVQEMIDGLPDATPEELIDATATVMKGQENKFFESQWFKDGCVTPPEGPTDYEDAKAEFLSEHPDVQLGS